MSKKILKVKDIKSIIEDIIPIQLQEEWDNSGLNIGFENSEVKKILICLEINDEVMNEAIINNVNLIITHHPLIFGSIKNINDENYINRIVIKAIQNNISVYSCHTPFDKVRGGNNDYILKLIGINDADLLDDIGRVGELDKATTFKELIHDVVNNLNLSIYSIKTVGDLEAEIKKVGVCTGAGADLAQTASDCGCQAFITGDVKYHEAQTALQQGLCIIDAGHYGTEKFFSEAMQLMIQDKIGKNIEILLSEINLDPFV